MIDLMESAGTLQNAMEPFAMSPGKWRKKLMAIVGGNPDNQHWNS